jgi:hypothetical protein
MNDTDKAQQRATSIPEFQSEASLPLLWHRRREVVCFASVVYAGDD